MGVNVKFFICGPLGLLATKQGDICVFLNGSEVTKVVAGVPQDVPLFAVVDILGRVSAVSPWGLGMSLSRLRPGVSWSSSNWHIAAALSSILHPTPVRGR